VRIAILGARGQLGAAIVHVFRAAHDVTPLAHADLDVTDDRAVAQAVDRARPEAIINCAAFNDVDGAEDQPVPALDLNAFAVRALAGAASARGAALVHYSTDFVFDGQSQVPYVEDDRPNPRGVYAVSKLLGEWFATDAPRAYVLRVESLFGRAPDAGPAKGSVAGILKAIRAGKGARVFTDRIVSPTYVIDAARATRQLLEGAAPPGLYHCVNSGCCTWLELAQEMTRMLGLSLDAARLIPVTTAEVKLRAQRPQYCALSNEKLRSVGVSMPDWRDALARYLETDQRLAGAGAENVS
jgi:dTDP-4-dehydrorhamnose reductase